MSQVKQKEDKNTQIPEQEQFTQPCSWTGKLGLNCLNLLTKPQSLSEQLTNLFSLAQPFNMQPHGSPLYYSEVL